MSLFDRAYVRGDSRRDRKEIREAWNGRRPVGTWSKRPREEAALDCRDARLTLKAPNGPPGRSKIWHPTCRYAMSLVM